MTNKEIDKLLEKNNFKPVISLKWKVMIVKEIEKGEKVGYNRMFVAEEKTKISNISIGYADGLSFISSRNNFRVLIKGLLCPVIGNICMDTTIVKIPLNSDIKEGDIVTLFGYIDDGEKYLNYKEFLN